MPRGAKEKCTSEVIVRAVKLKKAGAMDKDIAAACGVRPETFCRWINSPKSENQNQLRQEIKKAEGSWRMSLEAVIVKAANERDWKAAAWLLERKDPKHYSLSPARFVEEAAEENIEIDPLTKSLMEIGGKL